MAYRFTDTEKWKDEWYGSLSNDNRIIWQYLLDNCTQAGIFKKDWRLLRFQCNTQITEQEFMQVFGGRVVDMGNYFFIPKFLKFQNKKGLNSNKPAIVSIREELIRNNLIPIVRQSLGNDFLIIKGIGKGKGTDKGEGTGSEIETGDFKYEFKPAPDSEPPGVKVSPAECLEMINGLCEYFAIITDPMSPKYNAVDKFVEMIIHRGQFETLKTSFSKYQEYKARSQESKHGIEKWMGTIENYFKDGEWFTTDWKSKLDNLEKNERNNFNQRQGAPPAASTITPTGKGFGDFRRRKADG